MTMRKTGSTGVNLSGPIDLNEALMESSATLYGPLDSAILAWYDAVVVSM